MNILKKCSFLLLGIIAVLACSSDPDTVSPGPDGNGNGGGTEPDPDVETVEYRAQIGRAHV